MFSVRLQVCSCRWDNSSSTSQLGWRREERCDQMEQKDKSVKGKIICTFLKRTCFNSESWDLVFCTACRLQINISLNPCVKDGIALQYFRDLQRLDFNCQSANVFVMHLHIKSMTKSIRNGRVIRKLSKTFRRKWGAIIRRPSYRVDSWLV